MNHRSSRISILVLALCLLLFSLPGLDVGRDDLLPFSAAEAGDPPVAYGGNWSFIKPGDEVFLSAVGSYDPDDDLNGNGGIDGNETNTLAKFEWDFEGDGVYDWESNVSGNVPHKYTKEGHYNATLRVTDSDGMTHTAIFDVFCYKDEGEDEDPEFSKPLYLLVGAGEVAFGVFLVYLAYDIRKKYYLTAGAEFPIFSEKDQEKMAEERELADKLGKEQQGQTPGNEDVPGEEKATKDQSKP